MQVLQAVPAALPLEQLELLQPEPLLVQEPVLAQEQEQVPEQLQ
jgi:hypothetical protein